MKSNFKKIVLLFGLSITPVNFYAMEADKEEIEPKGSELAQSSNRMGLPDELIVLINSYLMPSPNQFPGEILEKLEDTIIFFSSSKQLKNILENEVIATIRSKIDQYLAIQNSKKENLLQLAIEEKKYNVAHLLIKAGFNPDSLTTGNLTMLFAWAISNGHTEIAQICFALIPSRDYQSLVTMQDKSKETLLHKACQTNNQACVLFLLDNGAQVNALDDNGYTALDDAARTGNLDAVKLLVKHNADVNLNHRNTRASFKLSPLFHAITSNHHEIVQFLLDNGANANIKTSWGLTPLTCAKIISHGCSHDEILGILLRHGAVDDNFENVDKDKTLSFAIYLEHDSVESIRLLLREGASLEANTRGRTPLISAIAYNRLNIAKYLIDRGANIHAKTYTGNTALSAAILGQNITACALLIQYGAKINDRTENGMPIIFHCIAYLNEEMILFLIAHGLNVNCADQGPRFDSLLIMIIQQTSAKSTLENRYKIAKILIKNGAEVNYIRPSDTATPLRLSARYNHLLIARLLIKNGANIHCTSKSGKTALDLAIENKNTEMMVLLTEAKNKRNKKK